MARDLYADARRVATCLSEEGLPESADRIEDMIAEGATPTEILMGVRWLLGDLLAREARLSSSLRTRVAGLERAIDEILK